MQELISETVGVPSMTVGGTPAGEPALSIRGASKNYGGVRALDDVSLIVFAGEVVALVGENGAGKSTLVGVASGRIAPDAGEVSVNGTKLAGGGPASANAVGVRLVPQELLLCDEMSVLDNVLLGQRPVVGRAFLDRKSARKEAANRLQRLNISLNLDAPVSSLSVVEKAFVQIARSLTPGAAVMLVDEPTAPMDDSDVESFLRVMRAITAEGIGILYISHRLDEVFQLANRVAIMRDGRMVEELAGANISRSKVISAMVGGRELKASNAREAVPLAADTVLSVRGLTRVDLFDISFDLQRGELLAVYGINGSGRESLGGAIVGALRTTKGSVHIENSKTRPANVADAVALGVGYVPAERRSLGLDLDASVGANLTWAILRKLSRFGFLRSSTIHSVASDWIKRLQVKTSSSKSPVGALSGGSQQKVLLARWLAAGSKVLVLEEPTRGIDVATKAEIYNLLRELSDAGTSVLVITSDIEEASIVASRVLVMNKGAIGSVLTNPTQSELAAAAQVTKESTNVHP